MRRLIKKLSLSQQCVITSTLIFVFILLLYFLYLAIIFNTPFFTNYQSLAHILYWIFALPLGIFLNVLLLGKIIEPIAYFIDYCHKFRELNFKEIEEKLPNSDFKRLCIAFEELQSSLNNTIDELRKKNSEITLLNEKQKKDLIMKRNLVSSISHDIKTPLTIIHTTISAIRDGIFTPEEIPNELENILNEVEKTNAMLKDTINIYHMENESYQMNISEISLITLINEITISLAKLFEKHHQTLKLNLPSDVIIEADEKQMTRALNNLIVNAITHSPENNTVEINLISNVRNDILEIVNTGTNIDENDINHVFEAFYRGDKSRTKTDDYGNGLGLYSAKEIIKRHNFELGVINLDNAVKFYIVFPKNKN